jgi:hypothetical protein
MRTRGAAQVHVNDRGRQLGRTLQTKDHRRVRARPEQAKEVGKIGFLALKALTARTSLDVRSAFVARISEASVTARSCRRYRILCRHSYGLLPPPTVKVGAPGVVSNTGTGT